jgi:hypothetical protein
MKKIFIFWLILVTACNAQQNLPKKFDYRFEIGSYFSITNKLPFWQSANQFGSIPSDLPAFLCRQSIKTHKDTLNRFFRFDYGFEAVTILGKNPQFLFPEGFLCTKLGKFELYAGRRKEIFGIVYTLISPLIDIAFNDAVQLISAQQLVTLMLFSHIGTYFFLKRNENK